MLKYFFEGGIGGRFGRSASPEPRKERSPDINLTPEERDARTIFVMQLSQRVRARDVEEFFSSVGKIKDVRLIVCNKTRRFKGIAYVEFREMESVALVSFAIYFNLLKQKYKLSYFFPVGPWLKWTKIMWSPSHRTAISSRKKSR